MEPKDFWGKRIARGNRKQEQGWFPLNNSFFLINLEPDERLAQNVDGCSRKQRNQGCKMLLRLQ